MGGHLVGGHLQDGAQELLHRGGSLGHGGVNAVAQPLREVLVGVPELLELVGLHDGHKVVYGALGLARKGHQDGVDVCRRSPGLLGRLGALQARPRLGRPFVAHEGGKDLGACPELSLCFRELGAPGGQGLTDAVDIAAQTR